MKLQYQLLSANFSSGAPFAYPRVKVRIKPANQTGQLSAAHIDICLDITELISPSSENLQLISSEALRLAESLIHQDAASSYLQQILDGEVKK